MTPGPLDPDTGFSIGKLAFDEPVILLIGGFALGAIIVGLVADAMRRRTLTGGRLGKLPMLRAMLASSSPGRRKIKAIALGLAVAGLVIALAQPHVKSSTTELRTGLDLVIALDVSKSMMVNDSLPSRLEQARTLAKAILDETKGDRVAPVVFAGAAAHLPLTDDHELAKGYLTDFLPSDLPVGSDLGEALRVSRCLLRPDLRGGQLGCPGIQGQGHGGDPLPGEDSDDRRRHRRGDVDETDDADEEKEERGKAIVVFTDGADDDGKAAEDVGIASQLGITVFVVGLGTEKGGEVWDIDDDGKPTTKKKDASGNPIISKRDDEGMRQLAMAAGDASHYVAVPPTANPDPRPLLKAIGSVKRGISARKVKKARPVYHWFLFPAFMLFVIEALVSTRKRVVPDLDPATATAVTTAVTTSMPRPRPAAPPGRGPLPPWLVSVVVMAALTAVCTYLVGDATNAVLERRAAIVGPVLLAIGVVTYLIQRRRVERWRSRGTP